MGFLDKIMKKIGDAMEKSAVKQMSEEDKEKYEQEKKEQMQSKPDLPAIREKFAPDELKDLEGLLTRVGAIDSDKVWISGFVQHRSNQNAKAANLFSGKKNMRFITHNNGLFYMLGFEKDVIKSLVTFKLENVIKAKNEKVFSLQLNLNLNIKLDITDNKKMAKALVALLLKK